MKRKFSSSRLIKLIQVFLWVWFIITIIASQSSFKEMADSKWTPWACPKHIQPNYTKTETSSCGNTLKYELEALRDLSKTTHWECYQSYNDYVSYKESLKSEQKCERIQNKLIQNIIIGITPLLIFYILFASIRYIFPKQHINNNKQ